MRALYFFKGTQPVTSYFILHVEHIDGQRRTYRQVKEKHENEKHEDVPIHNAIDSCKKVKINIETTYSHESFIHD